MKQKGSFFAEQFNRVNLENCGSEPFKVTAETYYMKIKCFFFQDNAMSLQDMADNVIQTC